MFVTQNKFFLIKRPDLVAAGGVLSRFVSLKSGLPQGSVICPSLFNIYVNNLYKTVAHSPICEYPDETVLPYRHLTYVDVLTNYDMAW